MIISATNWRPFANGRCKSCLNRFARGTYASRESRSFVRCTTGAMAWGAIVTTPLFNTPLFFLSAGVSAQNIIVCEAREPRNDYYSHIFSALETPRGVVILDNLPESKFNQLDYPGELVRFTRVSEYL